MIWHILKKDFRLLWPMVAGVAAFHFVRALLMHRLGHFAGGPGVAQLIELVIFAEFVGSALLIAVLVHQDAIPGVRQDWLVRPIRRRDLLLEKMLFVFLLVEGPMVVADIFSGLFDGFSATASVGAALSRGVFFLSFMFLGALAFASLTRNLTQTIAAGVIVFLGLFTFIIITQSFSTRGQPPFWVDNSGLTWIAEAERSLVCLILAAVVLGLQFFRRRTTAGYSVFAAGATLWWLTFLTPWQPAFAIQEMASPNRNAANAVAIAFEPSALPKASPLGMPAPDRRAFESGARSRVIDEGVAVSLPVRIAGMPNDAVLKADRAEVRLIPSDGRKLNPGAGDGLEIFREGASAGTVGTYQSIHVPQAMYQRLKNEPVKVEINYSLTLMRLARSYGIAALDSDQRLPQLGWCKTRMNDAQTAIQLRCLNPAKSLHCGSAFLENTATGSRNPIRHACDPSYSPYVDSIYDSIARFGVTLAFRDPTGLAVYPVAGSQLPNARVVIRDYEPAEHFTRRLEISNIQLSTWSLQ